MKYKLTFASDVSFLNPLKTDDGKPYGPIRYEQIVKEAYVICKSCYCSYQDVLDMSVVEKNILLKLIQAEIEKAQERNEKLKAEVEAHKKRH